MEFFGLPILIMVLFVSFISPFSVYLAKVRQDHDKKRIKRLWIKCVLFNLFLLSLLVGVFLGSSFGRAIFVYSILISAGLWIIVGFITTARVKIELWIAKIFGKKKKEKKNEEKESQ